MNIILVTGVKRAMLKNAFLTQTITNKFVHMQKVEFIKFMKED